MEQKGKAQYDDKTAPVSLQGIPWDHIDFKMRRDYDDHLA